MLFSFSDCLRLFPAELLSLLGAFFFLYNEQSCTYNVNMQNEGADWVDCFTHFYTRTVTPGPPTCQHYNYSKTNRVVVIYSSSWQKKCRYGTLMLVRQTCRVKEARDDDTVAELGKKLDSPETSCPSVAFGWLVGWSIGRVVGVLAGRSVLVSYEGRKVTLPCYNRSTCYLLELIQTPEV